MSPVALERVLVGRRMRDGIACRGQRAGAGAGGDGQVDARDGQVNVRDGQRIAIGVDALAPARSAGSDFISVGGEPTLDALLSGVWEGLAAHSAVACPICVGELRPEYGAHALPIGGRCVECGTRVS